KSLPVLPFFVPSPPRSPMATKRRSRSTRRPASFCRSSPATRSSFSPSTRQLMSELDSMRRSLRSRPPTRAAEVVTLAVTSGAALAVEIREPRGPVLGTTILLHPFMTSRRVWDWPRDGGFTSMLNEAGLRTLALDFRGHGESVARGAAEGYDELLREDIPAVCHAARERWPAQRLILVGHSLGGHAAIASVSTGACAPDAVVIIAANVWVPRDEPNPVLRAKKAAIVRTCSIVTRAAGYFPARRL